MSIADIAAKGATIFRLRKSALRAVPPVTLLLFLGPVAAGLIGTLLPAFGYLPVLGGETLSLAPWRQLLAAPGLAESVRLSFVGGLATTAVALAVVILFCAGWHGTRGFARVQRLLSPLLSVPHVTVAFGLAFVLAPSGWILRLVSPWATGLARPPDLIIVHDPAGLTLIAGLAIKEIPFLFLMTLAAIGQVDAARTRTMARTLGYGPVAAWLKAVFPQVYPQIRLPVFAVLAYAVSVVDVAIVLAPTTPPPLAVQLVRWFNDPDLAMRFVASAGAILQLAIVVAAMALWWLGERALICGGRMWIRTGWRWRRDLWVRRTAALALVGGFAVAFFSLLSMALWSVAGRWRFPEALPDGLNLATWVGNADRLTAAGWNTLSVGIAVSVVALVFAVGCLENEARFGHRATNRALLLLYLPLLVPQVAFLFGAQVMLIVLNIDGSWLAVAWSHLVFVLPYVFLSLADPYRSWDDRYARTALCLGAGPWRVLRCIKLPMLLRPVLVAVAVGFAVSVSLYLPTLFAGAGRFDTLTTEAVSLAASGNRRIIGAYALMQMLLPFLAFTLAAAVPAWMFRHRRGLRVTL
ncbi:MAG: ABC transporter permease subunit [Alphaproteobacteria bacterium]|nr:ABC transporter permease subunit [Alphaproteobacteria bacterium]